MQEQLITKEINQELIRAIVVGVPAITNNLSEWNEQSHATALRVTLPPVEGFIQGTSVVDAPHPSAVESRCGTQASVTTCCVLRNIN